jgi:hypothetical protein
MPLTQYLWAWDRFMHGGPDFELGALMVLTALCLALVLPKHCKQYVYLMLAPSHHASLDLIGRSLRKILVAAEISIPRARPAPNSGIYSIPLQI